jgi:hypothetical protein
MGNMIDFKALGAKAAAEGADQTKTTAGGGDFTPAAAGPCNLRFVSYIEVGKVRKEYKGKPPKVQNEVWLTFELSGPRHPPREMDDGTKVPYRITLKENLSLNEKARFTKLFNRMNYAGGAQHMVQLLGEAYQGEVLHRTWKGADGKERIEAELYNKAEGTFTIKPPRFEVRDPETGAATGEFRVVKVDPPITELKAFLWQYADKPMWDSLFIDGEWPERKNDKGEVTAKARSKNVLQNQIKLATNFKGSPIYEVLAAAGANLDIPEPDTVDEPAEDEDTNPPVPQGAVPQGAAADDALNGIA